MSIVTDAINAQQAEVIEQEAKVFSSSSPFDTKMYELDSRCESLTSVVNLLKSAEEIATNEYLINSDELSRLIGITPAAVTVKGEKFPWRNWVVTRVRKEGNQLLWQLERVV